MSYLQALKDAVSKAFANCQDKESIDNLVNINTAIDKADGEMASLMDKNKELIAAYKEAVTHPGVTKEQPKDDTVTIERPKEVDISDFIRAAIREQSQGDKK